MINEIKKDLYKSKVMATFSHYSYGKLYYTFNTLEKKFIFPIHTVENEYSISDKNNLKLSADLGETNFRAEIKASDLNRWIEKAVELKELIEIV